MDLTDLDKSILVTIYSRGGRSKTAHFPEDFICRGYPSHLHGKIKKRIRRLRIEGILYIKPHPSGPSYGLTNTGWEKAKELEDVFGL